MFIQQMFIQQKLIYKNRLGTGHYLWPGGGGGAGNFTSFHFFLKTPSLENGRVGCNLAKLSFLQKCKGKSQRNQKMSICWGFDGLFMCQIE